ncbi:MAG: ATP-binding cassette domain-containing protein [Bdellovibrio sp.]|nr:ATP-binding cassette domain-containing protein [Bdellovibrio sp.]
MIQVSHLTKMYGSRPAIDDLSFEIQKGEIVGFLGPNGAGKTTTMKILTCFMPATSGTAVLEGFDVFENPIEVKRKIGYLPEIPPVYSEMRVKDYIEYAALLHEVPKSKLKQAVNSAIEKVSIGDVQNRLIGNLSKGYRQRVGLAQALVHNPEILILDEPTIGLDPKQIIEIRELIKTLGGTHTIILSSHILPEVTATCQRIIVINKGRIVGEDTLEGLSARMKKGLLYSMIVKNPSQDGLAALKQLPGIKTVSHTGSKIVIELQHGTQDMRDKIVETAVKKGMGVLEFSSEKISLEEVFLQLTTEESTIGNGSAKTSIPNLDVAAHL